MTLTAQARPRRHFGTRGPSRLTDLIQLRQSVAEPTVRIPVDRIDPSPRNPRQRLDVTELKASICAYGLLQPVVVREVGARYELIAGHRRHAALRALAAEHSDDSRWREVDAVVRDAEPDQAYLLTLAENLQRTDLSPREEAAALEVLVRQEGWSIRRVAEAIHRAPAHVSKRLRVFEDDALAPAVLANTLSVSTAEELLNAPVEQRTDLVRRAAEGAWGQSQARRAVRECFGTKRPGEAALEHLRAAVAALDGAGNLPDDVCGEARVLLRALGRRLRS
jgi:ParB family chromosome partitioning protein